MRSLNLQYVCGLMLKGFPKVFIIEFVPQLSTSYIVADLNFVVTILSLHYIISHLVCNMKLLNFVVTILSFTVLFVILMMVVSWCADRLSYVNLHFVCLYPSVLSNAWDYMTSLKLLLFCLVVMLTNIFRRICFELM